MRVVRSDKLMNAISDFVVKKLGVYFITPPDFDLGIVFKDSSAATPLIFVLSPGADPLASLQKYAEKKESSKRRFSWSRSRTKSCQVHWRGCQERNLGSLVELSLGCEMDGWIGKTMRRPARKKASQRLQTLVDIISFQRLPSCSSSKRCEVDNWTTIGSQG